MTRQSKVPSTAEISFHLHALTYASTNTIRVRKNQKAHQWNLTSKRKCHFLFSSFRRKVLIIPLGNFLSLTDSRDPFWCKVPQRQLGLPRAPILTCHPSCQSCGDAAEWWRCHVGTCLSLCWSPWCWCASRGGGRDILRWHSSNRPGRRDGPDPRVVFQGTPPGLLF